MDVPSASIGNFPEIQVGDVLFYTQALERAKKLAAQFTRKTRIAEQEPGTMFAGTPIVFTWKPHYFHNERFVRKMERELRQSRIHISEIRITSEVFGEVTRNIIMTIVV